LTAQRIRPTREASIGNIALSVFLVLVGIVALAVGMVVDPAWPLVVIGITFIVMSSATIIYHALRLAGRRVWVGAEIEGNDAAARLERLDGLLEKRLISPAEHAAKRQHILDGL